MFEVFEMWVFGLQTVAICGNGRVLDTVFGFYREFKSL